MTEKNRSKEAIRSNKATGSRGDTQQQEDKRAARYAATVSQDGGEKSSSNKTRGWNDLQVAAGSQPARQAAVSNRRETRGRSDEQQHNSRVGVKQQG